MAANTLNFFIDIPNRRLIRDFFSNLEVIPQPLVQGDTVHLRIIGVEPNIGGNPSRPWRYVSLPTSLYLGIGPVGALPSLGTFTLTFGADTTSALASNITAAALATALNGLASITSAGGVAVTGPNSGPFQIVFLSNGARADITGDADLLYPLSTIENYPARTGDASTPAIQVLVIDLQPAALAQTFTAITAPGITIASLQTGASGVPAVQQISLDPSTHDGSFTLSFGGQTTAALAYNIAASDLQTALQALSSIGVDNMVVSGAFPNFVVTFQGTLTGPQSLMTSSAAGLMGPVGVEGDLPLNTAGIEQLIGAEASIATKLEISAAIGGAPITLIQTDVTLLNDQIPNTPASGTGLPAYYTKSEVDATFALKTGDSIAHLTADAATTTPADAATTTAQDATTTTPADAATTTAQDAATTTTLASTYSNTEVAAALNALGTKLNAVVGILNATATKLNTAITAANGNGTKLNTTITTLNDILTELEAAALLTP